MEKNFDKIDKILLFLIINYTLYKLLFDYILIDDNNFKY